MARILVVDDDQNILTTMGITLKREGHEVDAAVNFSQASKFLGDSIYDIVITDLRMEEQSGIDVLKRCKEVSPETEVIVLTAFGSLQTAIEALREDACDYILKPCGPDQIIHSINRVLEKKKLLFQIRSLKKEVASFMFENAILGKSPSILNVQKKVSLLADTDATVLISGETGTGKELIAKAIHAGSRRNTLPLTSISCAALPENLLESELFGHVRGAFSGAITNKKGLVAEAHQGTLFLDEIGEMPLLLQSKLLRFIEEGEIRPVGSNKTSIVDVRIIAATNKDLDEAVAKNNFRKDLYYRLKVVSIHLPPLRSRGNDVILLANHFVQQYANKTKKPRVELSKEAMKIIKDYDWPGNIRELKHVIEGALIVSEGAPVVPEHLDIPSSGQPDSMKIDPENMALSEITRRHLLEILERCHWNQKKASKVLGISKATLWRKLKDYNIDVKSIKDSMTT